MQRYKFKEGDSIIIRNDRNGHHLHIGKEVVLSRKANDYSMMPEISGSPLWKIEGMNVAEADMESVGSKGLTTFKVGDVVRTTTGNESSSNCSRQEKGYEFIIRQVHSDSSGPWYRETPGVTNGVMGSDLELVSSNRGIVAETEYEELPCPEKWEPGMLVRATFDCSGSKKGKIYSTVKFGSDCRLEGTTCSCQNGWRLVRKKYPVAHGSGGAGIGGGGRSHTIYEAGAEFIKPVIKQKTVMSKVGIMMKKLLDADTQKLVKAGFINGNLELTEEGQTHLNSVVFETNKAALVTLAEEKIAEEKESK